MYEPTLNRAWHFNSITLQVEKCQINEGESPIQATWTTTCTCGCFSSSCVSWLFNFTSVTKLIRFNYQRWGSLWDLHSGRTLWPIRVSVLEGHAEKQIRCRSTAKTIESCQNWPWQRESVKHWCGCDSSGTCVTDPNQKQDPSATLRPADKRSGLIKSSQPDCTPKPQSGMFFWVPPLRIRTPKVSSGCFFNKASQQQTWNVVCWTSGMELLTIQGLISNFNWTV